MPSIARAPAVAPRAGTRRPSPSTASPGHAPRPAAAPSLQIVHVTAECAPFARTGGLGEAVRTLAEAQIANGDDACAIMPLYGRVRASGAPLEVVVDVLDVPFGAHTEHVRLLATPPRQAAAPRTYFVEHPVFAERVGLYGDEHGEFGDNAYRFGLFSAAVVAALPTIADADADAGDRRDAPDARVLHAHDWHAALAPVYLRRDGDTRWRDAATVLSVHNAAFQGEFGSDVMPLLGLPWELFDWQRFERYGRANLLKGGIAFADVVTTVSPRHAGELRTLMGGFGLHETFDALGDRLVGVLNGIDQRVWDPSTDPTIAARFSAADLSGKRECTRALQRTFGLPERDDVPVFGFCARLTAQKGLDLLLGSGVLTRSDAQFVVLGEGEARYAHALHRLAAEHPDRLAVQTTFTDAAEHVLLAGADACLMPSVYEPCGLTQMRAQRYGTIPVAHEVGGLADTIADGESGILFSPHAAEALTGAVARAIGWHRDAPSWEALMRRAMARDFGWARSAAAYRDAYQRALAAKSLGRAARADT